MNRLLIAVFVFLTGLLGKIEADMNVTPWSPISPVPTPTPTAIAEDGVYCSGHLCIEFNYGR
jgi:hypothetical protein